MEIRYARGQGGCDRNVYEVRNFASYITLVDAAEKLPVNQVEDADRVGHALGRKCCAAKLTAQHAFDAFDDSDVAAARESGP